MVFHLAAQALVRRSYIDPVTTFETNTMGMVNLLECVRTRPWIEVAVLITSDKAYRNDEWCWGYRETDALGGHDPYSGSKSCADLVAHYYCHSFLRHTPTRVAITRAGNVIGGGDWAEDRIVPDCIRAWSKGESVSVRSPQATRPWQHVLEPLSGYLALAEKLYSQGPAFAEAFSESDNYTIEFNNNHRLTGAQKATVLAGQLLADYMYFDGNTEKCKVDDSGITIYCFYCSIIGLLTPCCLYIPFQKS
jgi:CDP-glucose 4,6-dehydratase